MIKSWRRLISYTMLVVLLMVGFTSILTTHGQIDNPIVTIYYTTGLEIDDVLDYEASVSEDFSFDEFPFEFRLLDDGDIINYVLTVPLTTTTSELGISSDRPTYVRPAEEGLFFESTKDDVDFDPLFTPVVPTAVLLDNCTMVEGIDALILTSVGLGFEEDLHQSVSGEILTVSRDSEDIFQIDYEIHIPTGIITKYTFNDQDGEGQIVYNLQTTLYDAVENPDIGEECEPMPRRPEFPTYSNELIFTEYTWEFAVAEPVEDIDFEQGDSWTLIFEEAPAGKTVLQYLEMNLIMQINGEIFRQGNIMSIFEDTINSSSLFEMIVFQYFFDWAITDPYWTLTAENHYIIEENTAKSQLEPKIYDLSSGLLLEEILGDGSVVIKYIGPEIPSIDTYTITDETQISDTSPNVSLFFQPSFFLIFVIGPILRKNKKSN